MAEPRTGGWSRRDVLRAGSAAAAIAATGALAIACGDDSKGKSATKAVRDVSGRPATAKTTKRAHAKPQPSASRSHEPLPPALREYVARKHREGALVKNDKSNVVHHPVVCKQHLNGLKPTPRKHKKRKALVAAKKPVKPAVRRKPHAEVVVHAQFTDGILYSLLRAEADARMRLGIALTCALAWPVSVRFADLALASLKKDGKPVVDDASVAAALAVAQTQGGALPMPLGPTGARAADAVKLLRARLVARAGQKDRPKKPERRHR
jgi:hypothetical protein